MDLSEIIEHLDVEYDVHGYMVVRKEFLNFIAEVNGVMFDAFKAFQLLLADLQEQQKEFDKRRNAEGKFVNWKEEVWSALNQRFIERNVPEGSNLSFVGNYCIVTVYQFWEEYIRPRIAQIFGVEKNEVAHPLFGDIRNIRNAIIHNHNFATEDVERNEIFKWYKRGDLINLEKEKYFEISQSIFRAILDHELIPSVGDNVADFLRKHPI